MSLNRLTPETRARAETLVNAIRGVTSCRIQIDHEGNIVEVHVVASAGKPPKLVARDVESALKAGLDIDVDYRKIGVVVVDNEAPAPDDDEAVVEFPILEHTPRFAFVTVSVATSRDGIRAEVELSRDNASSFGASQTDNVTLAPWMAAAEATLRAVSEFLDGSTRLCLSGGQKMPLGGADVIVVRVDVITTRYTKNLVGCALANGNDGQSAVFATLDAVNRVIGKLDFKSSIEYKIQ